MKLQRLLSYVRQAVDDYNMIDDGDKIAVGMSGGKDSYTLLYALAGLRSFYPTRFDIVAITVDLGYEGFDTDLIKGACDRLDVEYYVVPTRISEMIGDKGCSLCARLRKGAFGEKASELGCNKMAYAHNRDDAVETIVSGCGNYADLDDDDTAIVMSLMSGPKKPADVVSATGINAKTAYRRLSALEARGLVSRTGGRPITYLLDGNQRFRFGISGKAGRPERVPADPSWVVLD